jgi:hypothetical protein
MPFIDNVPSYFLPSLEGASKSLPKLPTPNTGHKFSLDPGQKTGGTPVREYIQQSTTEECLVRYSLDARSQFGSLCEEKLGYQQA